MEVKTNSKLDSIFSLLDGDKKDISKFVDKRKELNISNEEFTRKIEFLSDEKLILLHKNTNWEEPGDILYQRHCSNIENVDDEILFVLTQKGLTSAKEMLLEKNIKNLKKTSDEILVMMVQEEKYFSREAKSILAERYQPFVKNIIIGGGYYINGFTKEDLISEGMIGLLKAIESFDIKKRKKFYGFSKEVIKRNMGTKIKHHKNSKNIALNDSISYHNPVDNNGDVTFEQTLKSDDSYDPERILIINTLVEEVSEPFTELEKSVLEPYSEGYKYDEIAEKLGIDKKTVDNAIQRFRTKRIVFLIDYYDKEGYSKEDIKKMLKIKKDDLIEKVLKKKMK